MGSRGNYAAALRVSADDYRLSLQLRVKHLLHRNEEGIQINMEDTASHETAYKLAHGSDKANFSSKSAPPILAFVQFTELHKNSFCVTHLIRLLVKICDGL